MYKDQKIIAVIPARGGSKGIPGKNIKPIYGKPLIAWTIETALASEHIDDVIVSTDSKEIREVAERYGARVPFLRPGFLAEDTSTSMDVVLHALDYLEIEQSKTFDILIMLEPTSPLREVKDIDQSLVELVNHKKARSIAGVAHVEGANPDFIIRLEDGFMRSEVNFVFKRRQDVDDFYFYEGTIYASYVSDLRERQNFYHNEALGYVVPKWKSFEIDDPIDFTIIEHLLELREKGLLENE